MRITREPGTTPEKKAEFIRKMTQVMSEVLGNNPATTFVVIDGIDLGN